jgi:hypothetical protein
MSKVNQVMALAIVTIIARTASLWCAGKYFTQDPIVLNVLPEGQAPQKDNEITPAQLAELQASDYINVIEGEGKKAGPDLTVDLAAAQEALATMTTERNTALEQLEAVQAQLTEVSEKLKALELANAQAAK